MHITSFTKQISATKQTSRQASECDKASAISEQLKATVSEKTQQSQMITVARELAQGPGPLGKSGQLNFIPILFSSLLFYERRFQIDSFAFMPPFPLFLSIWRVGQVLFYPEKTIR
uniref:Uncharacterized protein n=1 Tax=Angiostrongylus cantonensis TaxID=6313 RepID=A0A0K0D7S4_ANGCA